MQKLSIDILRNLCHDKRIKWTLHALKRIRQRHIKSSAVIDAICSGEIITHYQDDKPFPSCLIFNGDNGAPIHVVASTDGETAYIITAYVPSADEWENDYVTRKG